MKVLASSAAALLFIVRHLTLLLHEQADASAKQEAARLGWRRLEALAAQKAMTALHKPQQISGSRQVQCSVEALRRRLKLSERRRCRDHPSRHAQHGTEQVQDALHEARGNVPQTLPRGGPKRGAEGLGNASETQSRAASAQQAACSDARPDQEGEDTENIAPGTQVDLNTLHQLLH